MCRWYCTSTGPNTDMECLWCSYRYCAACLHGDGGRMRSMVRCAKCGKNPRNLPDRMRGDWQTLGMDQYDPRVVNAKISLAEHKNEHKKTDRSRRLSMTKMDIAVLPRRPKSVVVTVSLEDTDSDEESTPAAAGGSRTTCARSVRDSSRASAAASTTATPASK
jgi:hypothetical protein